LELVEERARALGLRAVGRVSYEYGSWWERLPPPPAGPHPWPLLRFDFHREQEECPDAGDAAWGSVRVGPAAKPPMPVRDPAHFRRGVERIRALIRAGDCYQVNLVQAFTAVLPVTAAPTLFAALRTGDGGGYRALLEERGRALVCESPELFLARRGARLWTRPIKGTAADAEELLASAKDRAELAMIVDLLRNDLSRVCRPGSVAVEAFPELIRLPALAHTCATVTGRLRPGLGLADCFRAAFPCGSVTGCPRLRAMERIAGLEPEPRGPHFGALGWVEPDGDFLFCVTIRTALLEGGRLRMLAGGGITIASRPAAEEAESRLKTVSFARALAALPAGPDG
jgi:anthranilate/para-aminobenzoate synthase component I